MKKYTSTLTLCCCLSFLVNYCAAAQNKTLKLVFIRHAERPAVGDNLNCQGINRSLQLPAVLYKKFGRPTKVYIPSLVTGKTTRHSRMLQTISPFLIKYGLTVNSAYGEQNHETLGKALLKKQGTVLIVWEHKNIPPILAYIGIKQHLDWPDDDFDSIWIVTFQKGNAILTFDSENLHPATECAF